MRIYEILNGKTANNNSLAFPGLGKRFKEPTEYDYSEHPYMYVPWQNDELDPRWSMASFDKQTLISPNDAPDPRFRQAIPNDNQRLHVIADGK